MSKEILLAQITSNPHLPTPPSIALQVLEITNRPQCTIAEIARVIAHDPSLCAKILKVVNSALFGLPRAITSVDRSLQLLGLKRVRSLVLSLSLPSMQTRTKGQLQMRDYWKTSVATAIVARELAVQQGSTDPDSEMVSGLLCDIGVLIMQEVFPEQYVLVAAHPLEVLVSRQCALEEQYFGLHHAEVGAHILQRWRLPEDMVQAIHHHHDPKAASSFSSERAFSLYFAGRVAQIQLTVNQPTELAEINALARERFRMNDAQFQKFLEPLAGKIQEFANLLQVDIGTCQQYSTLFSSATENLTRMAVEASMDNIRVNEEKKQTEQKLKEKEGDLQRAEDKLRQALKLEAIGRLAGGVAHDFNNLLTVINGYSELLLSSHEADDPRRGFVEEIGKAGQRAADLTRQLLAFSRKQLLVPENIDINQNVAGMQKMLGRLIGEDIELIIKLGEGLPRVKVDPGQMDQVVMNLVINARDAMPTGGKLTLETKLVELDEAHVRPYPDLKAGPYVVLSLTDTGCGMTDDVKKKIFEPFFTTKEGVGTGLGLATVHGIVKQSGGHISVTSEENLGTTFRAYLPLAEEFVSPSRPDFVLDEIPRGSETILLTEDEEGVRRIAQHTLEKYGYKILAAHNGREALLLGEKYPGSIDILVTDAIMPHMGGCELAQRLLRTRPAMKVLYTSGYTDDSVIRQGVLTDETPFLQKPFTPVSLANKVREVLQGNGRAS